MKTYRYNIEATKRNLGKLRLTVMSEHIDELCNDPVYATWDWTEKLGFLVNKELEIRSVRRQERLIKESGLRETANFANATLENVIYNPKRNLDRELLERLVTCDWVRAEPAGTLLVTGATGTGKSYILNLLGRAACEQGLSVSYFRFPVLAEKMLDAYDHRTSGSLRKKLNSKKLLIIDDFGLGTKMSAELANDFLSLIDERMGFSATIIAGQIPPEEWYDFIGDNASADALIDRLFNRSYRIALEGPSLREGQQPPIIKPRQKR